MKPRPWPRLRCLLRGHDHGPVERQYRVGPWNVFERTCRTCGGLDVRWVRR